MDPYRNKVDVPEQGRDYSPRVVYDEPIYADRPHDPKRVRVVCTYAQVQGKVVVKYAVELALRKTATEDLAWEPLESLITEDARAALTALARGYDRL